MKRQIFWGFYVSSLILLIAIMLALVNKIVETVEADIVCFSSVLNLIVKVLVIWAILGILFAILKNVIGTDVEQFLKVFFGLEVIRRESDKKKIQRD